eukprot:13483892-Ditylum_brightwellii.AAC.1
MGQICPFDFSRSTKEDTREKNGCDTPSNSSVLITVIVDNSAEIIAEVVVDKGLDNIQGAEKKIPEYTFQLDYYMYLVNGVMDGVSLFSTATQGESTWLKTKKSKRDMFDPYGCFLAVKLCLFEDEEVPYFYNHYFCSKGKKEFAQTKIIFEVGKR